MPSVEEVMELDRELEDVCSWDRNGYILSGGTVDSPKMSSHLALSTAPA